MSPPQRIVRDNFKGLHVSEDWSELDPGTIIGGLDYDIGPGLIDTRRAWVQDAGFSGDATLQSFVNPVTQGAQPLTGVLPVVSTGDGLFLASLLNASGSGHKAMVQSGAGLSSSVRSAAFGSAATIKAGLGRWATPTQNEVLFQSRGGAGQRCDLSAMTFSAIPTVTVDGVAGRAFPACDGLYQSPVDQRLFAYQNGASSSSNVGPNGLATPPWRGWFSEPGDYTTWITTRVVDLGPNDGEGISGAIGWNGIFFVVKQSKMFVLRSVTPLANGSPVFNFQEVSLKFDAQGAVLCAGRQGVYIFARSGLYVTDGGSPVKLSGPVDPLFDLFPDLSPVIPASSRAGVGDPRSVCHCDGRVYLLGSGRSGTPVMLVYDLELDAWMQWSTPFEARALAASEVTTSSSTGTPQRPAPYLLVGSFLGSSNANLAQFELSPVGSFYNPTFSVEFAPIVFDDEGVMRDTHVLGAGPLVFGTEACSPALPDAPRIGRGRYQQAQRGQLLTMQLAMDTLSGTPQRVQIRRLTHDLEPRGDLGSHG